MKDDKKFVETLIYVVVAILLIFISYKWHEWKLEHIWEIHNPSFFQVWDAMSYKKK